MRPSSGGLLLPGHQLPLVVASPGSDDGPLQPYSPFADWLSKFHTASEPIQALWIVGIVVVALGIVWALTLPLRVWLVGSRTRGELVYGVYRDRQGRWLVYADGEVRALEEGGMAHRASWPGLTRPSTSSHAVAQPRRGSSGQARG